MMHGCNMCIPGPFLFALHTHGAKSVATCFQISCDMLCAFWEALIALGRKLGCMRAELNRRVLLVVCACFRKIGADACSSHPQQFHPHVHASIFLPPGKLNATASCTYKTMHAHRRIRPFLKKQSRHGCGSMNPMTCTWT